MGWQFEVWARCKPSNQGIGSWQFLSDWPTTMASSNFVLDAVSIKSLGINVRHHGKHPEYDDLIQIPTSHGQKAESSSKTSRTLLMVSGTSIILTAVGAGNKWSQRMNVVRGKWRPLSSPWPLFFRRLQPLRKNSCYYLLVASTVKATGVTVKVSKSLECSFWNSSLRE